MTGRLARACEHLVASTPLQTVPGESSGGYRAVGGPGALLVVLPGSVGPADALAALAPELGGGWRVCFVTYPRIASLDALLTWLEALRAREGGGAAAVYGGSFGGLLAQAWLRAHPQAIGDVVLSGTGPPDPDRAHKNARLLPWLRRIPMPAWRGLLRLVVRLSTLRTPDRDVWRRFYGQAIGRLTWPDLAARYQVSIDIDRAAEPVGPRAQLWRGRLLVLEGSRDSVARTSARAALRARYPAAAFHVFEGAGHGMALEQPDEWLHVVSAYFRT